MAAILIIIPLGDGSPWLRLLAIAASLLVIFETSWMLPLLDYRVGLIMAGKTPPPASLHGLYIAMEVAKLFLLMAMATNRGRQLVRMPPMP